MGTQCARECREKSIIASLWQSTSKKVSTLRRKNFPCKIQSKKRKKNRKRKFLSFCMEESSLLRVREVLQLVKRLTKDSKSTESLALIDNLFSPTVAPTSELQNQSTHGEGKNSKHDEELSKTEVHHTATASFLQQLPHSEFAAQLLTSQDTALYSQLLFLRGICIGNLDLHQEAYDTSCHLIDVCPLEVGGYYLKALSLNALNRRDEASDALKLAKEKDCDSRGESKMTDTLNMVGQLLKKQNHTRVRMQLKKHMDTYKCYSGLRCVHCNTSFPTPTPEWFCAKCWPKSYHHIWEPDTERGLCAVCNVNVGAMKRHHCRCCGKLVCADCSTHKDSLPTLGFVDAQGVRICNNCFAIRSERRRGLKGRSPKEASGGESDSKWRSSSPAVVLSRNMALDSSPSDSASGCSVANLYEDVL